MQRGGTDITSAVTTSVVRLAIRRALQAEMKSYRMCTNSFTHMM